MSKLIKTILITGGSNGIGEGIIKLLASKGHNIIFTYNKRSEKAKKIVIKNKIKKDQILPIKIDLEKHSQIDTLFSKIIKRFGKIDCLINNAAYFVTRKKFENISLDHAKKIMNINSKQYETYVVNSSHWMSEIGATLSKECDVAMIYYFDHDAREYRVSLRAFHEHIDVSEISKYFGGGGHKKAAGFILPMSKHPETLFENTSHVAIDDFNDEDTEDVPYGAD